MSFADFHFLRPLWLLAFAPLGLLAWQFAGRRLYSRSWQAVCDAALLPLILTGSAEDGGSKRAPLMLLAAGSLAILALAGPCWERQDQPVFRDASALVIVLDLSRSMDARDVQPSRLARARFKIADILAQRRSGQTALVVYAAAPFTVTPLTDDVETIRSQLSALTTDIMPAQGSRLELALERAAALLAQAGAHQGDVVVITDGVDEKALATVAANADRWPFRISVLAVATEQGAPVPSGHGRFIKDADGQPLILKLDAAPLKRLATLGGGVYQAVTADASDITAILNSLTRERQAREEDAQRIASNLWRDRGPWLLLPLLALVPFVFRRGMVMVLLLGAVALPRPASALDWEGLWRRPDQRGQAALAAGQAARAAELFTDPDWKAAAQYRAGDYEAALETLGRASDVRGQYNRGNALARLGRYQEAIASYEAVLAQDPDNADARYNRDLLQKLLDKQRRSGAGSSEQAPQQDAQGGDGQDGAGKRSRGDKSGNSADASSRGADAGGRDQQSREAAADDARSSEQPDDSRSRAGDETGQTQASPREQPTDTAPGDAGAEEQESLAAALSDEPADESEQATEQWLRRIPDDPGGLLRRKFLYQYRKQSGQRDGAQEPAW